MPLFRSPFPSAERLFIEIFLFLFDIACGHHHKQSPTVYDDSLNALSDFVRRLFKPQKPQIVAVAPTSFWDFSQYVRRGRRLFVIGELQSVAVAPTLLPMTLNTVGRLRKLAFSPSRFAVSSSLFIFEDSFYWDFLGMGFFVFFVDSGFSYDFFHVFL